MDAETATTARRPRSVNLQGCRWSPGDDESVVEDLYVQRIYPKRGTLFPTRLLFASHKKDPKKQPPVGAFPAQQKADRARNQILPKERTSRKSSKSMTKLESSALERFRDLGWTVYFKTVKMYESSRCGWVGLSSHLPSYL